MKKYPWGRKVSELLKKHDLRFEIVGEIPHKQMGSSPGDICWTGERLLAERTASPWHVVHEVAHFLVCKRNNPPYVFEQNWGFERSTTSGESEAANVTIALLIKMNLPFRWAADAMSMLHDKDLWPRKHVLGSERGWKIFKANVLREAGPYLEQTTTSTAEVSDG
jgi:hypothetical protein